MPGTSRGRGLTEARYLVHWACECCRAHPQWVTKTQLIRQFGISEPRLKQVEDEVIRDYKEKETKQ